MQAMLEAALDGTKADGVEGVEVLVRPALAATVSDVLAADGFLIGSSVNIGYLSGAVKHFFDTIYYPCLTAKIGAPYGLYLHGNNDATGALRAAESITKGLGWRSVHAPVIVLGQPSKDQRDQCWDLGATLAATVMSAGCHSRHDSP